MVVTTSAGIGRFLARAGWSEDAIHTFVWSICHYRGASQWADKHAATAAGNVARLKGGEETRGLPWLKETFGEAVATALAKIVNYRINEAAPPVSDGRTVIQVVPGQLSRIADKAEQALIKSGVQFYERANALVRVIVKEVDTFHGGKPTTAQFTQVDRVYMRDMLCRVASCHKLDKRGNKPIDVPHDIASTVLGRSGEWHFPSVAGIVTMPTMRPDGTILDQPGYDPATRLLLIDAVKMPSIPAEPTRKDALAALKLITDLLQEFVFADEVSKAVAVSATITPVVRGAFMNAPLHAIDAPQAGSGKSYLNDTSALIATGKRMPVISQGASDEEMEKRIGAAVLAGQPLVCIDNVSRVLRGDALAQLIERPRPQVRVLGRSELIEIEAVGTTLFANGINIIIGGDLTRRVILCRLDTREERPELRKFKHDPVPMILNDRGAYIAAALTIARAYVVAERPNRQTPLASFEGWSDTVRSALMWLGLADPVKSMESIRADDPDRSALLAVLTAWSKKFGTGADKSITLDEVIKAVTAIRFGTEFEYPELRAAVLNALGNPRQPPDTKMLGNWLRHRKNQIVNSMWIECKTQSHGATKWWIMSRNAPEAPPDNETY
jgi:putative DNA primase/helicase